MSRVPAKLQGPVPAPPAPAPARAPAGPDAASEVRYRPPRPSVPGVVRDAWRSRHLVRPMGFRVVAKMYAQTKLGRSWLVIRPAMDVGGSALIFGGVLGVSARDGTPYVIFLVVGLAGWRLFERTVYWSTRSFDRYARYTRRFVMPLLLLPIAGAAPALVEFCVYSGIVLLIAAGYLAFDGTLWLESGPQLLAGAGGLVLCLAMGLGLSLWTSVLNARTRDVRHTMRYVLQIWMFVTPVLYPLSQLPAGFRPLAQANPMTSPIELVKYGFLGAGDVQLVPVVTSVAAILAVLAGGLWFFSRQASHFLGPAGWGRGGATMDDDDDDDYGL